MVLAWLCLCAGLAAAPRTIGVFVALADNKHQGIVPVPNAIGNGDDPERNLYWGTAEGLRGYFDHSKRWTLLAKRDTPGKGGVLRTRRYRHVSGKAILDARAYRGAAIGQCLRDFETAVGRGSFDLVVYIGHNGLMDFILPMPVRSAKPGKRTDVIVLCCRSEQYFHRRLTAVSGHPVLLTTQLMYPGAFLLGAAAERWLDGGTPANLRAAAGRAYATNQHLSRAAALGVFAKLPQ